MHEAIAYMLKRYKCQTRDDYINALREIIQEIALLGLWRSKFFEHSAFYGGTALRILYGLDRYSEDLDFSLLKPDHSFSWGSYGEALKREISSFGFQVDFEMQQKQKRTAIESAFLKANTYTQLIVIEAKDEQLVNLHPTKNLKIKLEIDVDPPPGFKTETKYVLNPIPFSVRSYALPDLFAGKLHAILCRRWKLRIKGRDWYDLVWYISKYPEVNLSHLESRMRQSGDYREKEKLSLKTLHHLIREAVENLDVDKARNEVAPFQRDRQSLDIWSHDFFVSIIKQIVSV
ncbi:nucleotidyl transferase AbiEii/AbiGii toxin family protein [bacterium]|nr:nucleotidyl transferase AbiEii/AbiGii toxin family protein [bacterium]